jgi:hypothetical protein
MKCSIKVSPASAWPSVIGLNRRTTAINALAARMTSGPTLLTNQYSSSRGVPAVIHSEKKERNRAARRWWTEKSCNQTRLHEGDEGGKCEERRVPRGTRHSAKDETHAAGLHGHVLSSPAVLL